mmetsp:Transcript_6562/g.8513  ORF Transcript_6562/g.8513 Transcript_6562/m.8513 type:complete len:251 (-) Transcript_6562:400-1152(-)
MAAASSNLYVIEREVPGIQNLKPEELKGMSCKSNDTLIQMNSNIHWLQSYLTDDKLFCIYNASDENLISEHAKCGGFPCNKITQVESSSNDIKDSDSINKYFVEIQGDCASATAVQTYLSNSGIRFCVFSSPDKDSLINLFSGVDVKNIYPVHNIINPNTGSNDVELVTEVINGFGVNDWKTTFSPGCHYIRPSGNPLSVSDYEAMQVNIDIYIYNFILYFFCFFYHVDINYFLCIFCVVLVLYQIHCLE